MTAKPLIISALCMIGFTIFMLVLAFTLPLTGIPKMATYQAGILVLSLASLGLLRLVRGKPLELLRPGAISAPGKGMRVLLIKEGATWTNTGLSLVVVISLALGIFMYTGMRQSGATFSAQALLGNLPWILVFSLSNAWSEEVFYRLIPAEITAGSDGEKFYPLLSGIIFGAAHWWGSPGGPIGIIMSGILGYALARSVIETRGIFWALLIHVVQDLIIFGYSFGYGLVS